MAEQETTRTELDGEAAEAGGDGAQDTAAAGLPLFDREANPGDPAAKEAIEAHKKAIVELLARGPAAAWEVGAHVGAIIRGKLASRAGYRHLSDFIATELPAGRTRINLYWRLHRKFTAAEIKRHKVSRLSKLNTYLELTRSPRLPKLEDVLVRVPQAGDTPVSKPFADCSTDDLEAAVQFATIAGRRPSSGEFLARVNAALARATDGRVRIAGSLRRNRILLRLSAFDVRDIGAIGEVLVNEARRIQEEVARNPLTVL